MDGPLQTDCATSVPKPTLIPGAAVYLHGKHSWNHQQLLGSQGEALGLLLSYHRLTQEEQPCTQYVICSYKPKNYFLMSKELI